MLSGYRFSNTFWGRSRIHSQCLTRPEQHICRVLQPGHVQNGMQSVERPPLTNVPTTAADAQRRAKAVPAGVNHFAKAAALPLSTAGAQTVRLQQQRSQEVINKGKAVTQARPTDMGFSSGTERVLYLLSSSCSNWSWPNSDIFFFKHYVIIDTLTRSASVLVKSLRA